MHVLIAHNSGFKTGAGATGLLKMNDSRLTIVNGSYNAVSDRLEFFGNQASRYVEVLIYGSGFRVSHWRNAGNSAYGNLRISRDGATMTTINTGAAGAGQDFGDYVLTGFPVGSYLLRVEAATGVQIVKEIEVYP